MSHRERVSLKPPPKDVSELRKFPHRTFARCRVVWRATRRGRSPWWFSSSLDGRFDLPDPHGTCYLALDPVAALLELVGPDLENGAVSETFLTNRRIRRLTMPRKHRLANLADRRAIGFGMTAEIHTIVPYDLPQAWSLALRHVGAEGVLYRVRHDPSFEGVGIGLFGKSGLRTSWKRGRESVIDEALVEKLRRSCNIRVLPIPRSSELSIIDSQTR